MAQSEHSVKPRIPLDCSQQRCPPIFLFANFRKFKKKKNSLLFYELLLGATHFGKYSEEECQRPRLLTHVALLSLIGDPQKELQVGTADVWHHSPGQPPPPGLHHHKFCAHLDLQNVESLHHFVTFQVRQLANLVL